MKFDTYEEGPIKAKIMTGKRGRPPMREVGNYQRIGSVVMLYVRGQQPDDKELCKMFPKNLQPSNASNKEVLRIEPDGRIFWNGREVESDEMFRAAMIDLLAVLKEMK